MTADLPLTDLSFNILLALTGEELHGYALVKRLQELEGRGSLRTGTVYAALARLQDSGWVEEVDPPHEEVDRRRKYYRATEEGLAVARAEAARLSGLLRLARDKDLLGDPARG